MSGHDFWVDLGLAIGGAAAVSIVLWLLRSVVGPLIGLPVGANELIIVVGSVAVAVVLSRGGHAFRGAHAFRGGAFLIGAAVMWAIQNSEVVSWCTDSNAALYRPCTGAEVGLLVVPPTVLFVVGLLLLVSSPTHLCERHAIQFGQ